MSSAVAVLQMYPSAALREAWDALYRRAATSVTSLVADTPPSLSWDIDARDSWVHPRLGLGQTCGWPLVTELSHRVRVIGAFAHHLDGMSSHLYRSVIISREAGPLMAFAGSVAAINSADSLSGCISLLSAFAITSGQWPGPVLDTGGHVASIAAVREQRADIASIDALSWAYQQRIAPQSLDGLFVVGRGPLVPCLPLITRGDADDSEVAAWRSALADAMTDPGLARVRASLLIDDFVPLDLADYQQALADQTRSS
jgi:ABC-type phosphate/phosphonate transport system substrate-binding protein